jgi:pyruvate/2-oxoglutarate dehydrogenase complex dihydrolipoamide acyltransferase (E2) component
MTVATEELLERLAASPERFPGALLLTGPSEARLERESRRLAARLLCPGDDPDATCSSCRRVEAGLHPDFFPVEPEGLQIRIDRVREALAFSSGRPYESARRVARIARAELLGIEAENALLKSLEEPGEHFRWILTTTRPEALLTTIRSRATPAALPAPGRAQRQKVWRDRGFSDEDARDLVLFAEEDETDPAARLEEGRILRQAVVAALEEGIGRRSVAALVLCAELVASSERRQARVLAELLADAALTTAAPPAEALRHHAVAGRLTAIARRLPQGALREAAVSAADPPADNRRGNRRLHFERVLLQLYAARGE